MGGGGQVPPPLPPRRLRLCIYVQKMQKKVYLNSSVVNSHRTIISKTTCPGEILDDANRSFENNEECSNAFQ